MIPHLRRARSISPRTCCARKASPTSATCRATQVRHRRRDRPRRDRFRPLGRHWSASQLDAGEPVTALAGVHAGCYELFAHEPIRTISDLKGKRVGIQGLGSGGHLYLAIMAAHVGLDPHKDIDWVDQPHRQLHGAVCRGKGRRLPRLPARAAGAARPQGRPRDPQHGRRTSRGRSTSAAWWPATGSSSASIRSPPSASCAPSSRLPTCAPPSRSGGTTAGRWRVYRALRLRAPDADRAAVRQLARVRPGGHVALLRASAARGRHDQVEPEGRSSPRAPTGAS